MSNGGVHFEVTNEVAGMQSFVVLGIIPGTNIQTTLNFWIVFTILLSVITFRYRILSVIRFVYRYTTLIRIARAIDTYEFTTT